MNNDILIVDNHYKGLNPMLLGYEDCEAGHYFGPSVRTYWLLHYVVSGRGIFEREGRVHKLKAGDIFVIPPYLKTFYKADEKEPWRYIWVGFTADMTLPEILARPVINLSGIEFVFKDMLSCENLENGRTEYLCAKLWELMSLMLEEKEEPQADYVKKAKNIMRAEYIRGITVSQVAEALNLDRSYFSTLFKSKTGVSPQKYLIDLRLRRAAELMALHDESPTVAAFSVGYNDIYQFSKIFKKHFGVSPKVYKRNNLSKKAEY